MFPSLGSRSLRDAARTGKLVRPAGRSSYAFSATAPLTFWLPRGRKCTGTMDWSSYPQRQKGNIMSQQGRGERCSRDDLPLEVSLQTSTACSTMAALTTPTSGTTVPTVM